MKTVLSFFVFAGLVIGTMNVSNAQILDSPRDGVYDKIHVTEKKPIPYTSVRESDVAWKKRIWRTMDLRQKINHPFFYPETPKKEWKNFMTVIMDAIREGSITAYDPSKDDQFLVPLTYSEIEKKFSSIDTVPVYDPNNPQRILRYDVIKEDFNPSEVQRINLKEDWFFDKQRSVMDVRILGICPIRNVYDENDNFIGFEEMFWIYFPEARPVFAQAIVFNRNNGAERRTFDEIFWKRMFGSYVYKEENVYDRVITDYSAGMDALLEAERIKNELFEFEHELWEF
ncbi:MAG: gliding motility protein GldN [Bacteroidales bacterium]|nr:gliding motility protein GldN [Bacteroidales bacterium]MCF8402688.1 gliding motility protein GldN [Bacteroidales bacterium]